MLGRAAGAAVAALLLLDGAGVVRARAQCDTWTGLARDGQWTTAGNWTAGVPNSSTTNACISLSGASVSLDAADSVASLAVGGSDILNLADVPNVGSATLQVWGPSISNSGSISLNSIGDYVQLQIQAASATLGGGGTVTLAGGQRGTSFINTANSSGAALINQETIQGNGQVGEGNLLVTNQGIINANVTGLALIVTSIPQMTNTTIMEATGGGILELANSFTNTGGTIEAVGAGSEVLLCNANITGGTLTDSGGGMLVSGASSVCFVTGATWNTLTNTGTYQLQNGTYTSINGTIINNGSIEVTSEGTFTALSIPTNATLAGTGTVTLSGGPSAAYVNTNTFAGATFTNQQTIQGTGTIGEGPLSVTNQGTINANVSGQTLVVAAPRPMTNTGIMEATGGGILQLQNNLANTGGAIEAAGAGSEVVLCNANITGGTLTDSGGGVLISGGSSLCVVSGATWNGPLENAGTYQMQDGTTTYISGIITNDGTIEINSVTSSTELQVPGGGSATLAGTGVVTMSGPQAYITSSSGTLVNQETIEGAGNIGQGNLGVTNSGTIDANVSGQGIGINPGGAGLNNTGTLIVGSGATMDVYNTLLNLSGTTLTGGVY
ncbi:MAG TPA: hypothetical protein VG860_19070, partial [Terriglobia bacterium]|nr:hypothetical protein [Terriglobia bacterium]